MKKDALKITLPLDEQFVREKLRVGQSVLISGLLLTGRDKIHKYLHDQKPSKNDIPFELEGAVIYHSGPAVRQMPDGTTAIIAAGPTTSARMQIYEPFVIEHYGVRGIMGKGGMSGACVEAMQRHGAVYFHTIGGAGALLAQRIKEVRGVWMLEEFGQAEAMWAFEVEDFPAIVTIDAHGASIHEELERLSAERLSRLSAAR